MHARKCQNFRNVKISLDVLRWGCRNPNFHRRACLCARATAKIEKFAVFSKVMVRPRAKSRNLPDFAWILRILQTRMVDARTGKTNFEKMALFP